MAKKEKQAVWLYPEVKELLTTHMAAANAMSQSDFIEKAIRFYAGYLCLLYTSPSPRDCS